MSTHVPAFACDAMLGSLARWLRAAGYDAFWQEGIDDWDLIRRARAEGRILLSCDTGIFRVGIVRDGDVPALQLPHGLTTGQHLQMVLLHFALPLRKPRCMRCGGGLRETPKDRMAGKVPPRSYEVNDRFWECERCGQPFWRGTHWQRIQDVLGQAVASVTGPETPPAPPQ
jgi:uncharacterized protein with PIN domain